MDSFQGILDRVLKPVTDKVTQVLQGSQPTGRRPLRDPNTDSVGFMGDIKTAVNNIRSPEVAAAMHARAVSRFGPNSWQARNPLDDDEVDLLGDDDTLEDDQVGFSPKKKSSTFRDDARVFSDLGNAASSMLNHVVTAGKAIGEFSLNTGKLDDAVSDMTGSTQAASKAMKPTEGFQSLVQSMLELGKSSQDAGQQNTSTSPVGKKEHVADRISNFLNSSSIADGVRGLVGRLQAGSGGGGMRPPNDDDGSFRNRANNVIDSALHRSMNVFRSMSGRGQSAISKTIGRAGRRLLTRNFKNRVQRGGRMVRGMAGRAMGPSSSPAVRMIPGGLGYPGSISGIPPVGGGAAAGGGASAGGAAGGGGAGFFSRMFGSAAAGGAGAAAGGAAAGAGGGGAAAGGAAAGGAAAAGLAFVPVIGWIILAFLILIDVVKTVAKALYNLGMQGYETSLRVAQWDGALAAAKNQLEVHRLMRDIQSAGRLSDSGSRLIQKFDQLEAALRPFTDGALVVGMEFLILVVDTLTAAFRTLIDTLVMTVKLAAEATVNPFDDIAAKMLEDKIKDMMNPQGPLNVDARGLLGAFENHPIRPPRPPLPPLGGGPAVGVAP